MSFGLYNPILLYGLFAVAIPPLIHLLNRRRYQVVDWGAMQFLQLSHTRRRRLLIEDLLLMLLRMGLIATLVLALARPEVSGTLVAQFGDRAPRDVVFVFDGSYSMTLDDGVNPTPDDASRAWAKRFMGGLRPGDRVAVVSATRQPIAVVKQLSMDRQYVAKTIDRLPPPRGDCRGPAAVVYALELLPSAEKGRQRDIIVLSDGRRFGWADDDSRTDWKKTAQILRDYANETGEKSAPRLWHVDCSRGNALPKPIPNITLTTLRTSSTQVWVGQTVQLETALDLSAPRPTAFPWKLHLSVNGKSVRELAIPDYSEGESGRIPIRFSHRFTKPGMHVLSVVLQPIMPREQMFELNSGRDFLPADNRCDLAMHVRQTLPVLLIDGDERLSSDSSTFFLRQAFSASRDPNEPRRVAAVAVPAKKFARPMLQKPLLTDNSDSVPHVVVLADVPRLTAEQERALEGLLEKGGGVLISIGKRVADRSYYNQRFYRGGRGWLPAQLVAEAGDEENPSSPLVEEFQHPVLEIFRTQTGGVMNRVKFPRWWKTQIAGNRGATVAATLTTGAPLLIEKPYKKGKVLLLTVPLDASWDSNLPSNQELPILVHELAWYLAGATAGDPNLQPGQTLQFQPSPKEKQRIKLPAIVRFSRPGEATKSFQIDKLPFVNNETQFPGIYRVELAKSEPAYFVVQPERRESDLTPLSENERKIISDLLPIRFEQNPEAIAGAAIDPAHREGLWWLLLLFLVLLLCVEIGLTRRMTSRSEA